MTDKNISPSRRNLLKGMGTLPFVGAFAALQARESLAAGGASALIDSPYGPIAPVNDLTTGLPTHAQLLEHMTHLLALREREPAAMALIVLRLEGFRGAEQTLGVESANVLRRKAAVRLRAALRASDVVASLGGDLYAVLLAWIDAEADAEGVARKLLASLRQPFNVAGHDLPVMGSVGIGQYPAHGKDADALLRRAMAQASNGSVGELGRVGAGAANDE